MLDGGRCRNEGGAPVGPHNHELAAHVVDVMTSVGVWFQRPRRFRQPPRTTATGLQGK
jgi:hypothetical protein